MHYRSLGMARRTLCRSVRRFLCLCIVAMYSNTLVKRPRTPGKNIRRWSIFSRRSKRRQNKRSRTAGSNSDFDLSELSHITVEPLSSAMGRTNVIGPCRGLRQASRLLFDSFRSRNHGPAHCGATLGPRSYRISGHAKIQLQRFHVRSLPPIRCDWFFLEMQSWASVGPARRLKRRRNPAAIIQSAAVAIAELPGASVGL